MPTDRTTDEWLADLETDGDTEARDSTDLRAIGEALDDIDRADAGLTHAVVSAKMAGRSWTEIANVLGVTRQAARQRFDKSVPADTGWVVESGKIDRGSKTYATRAEAIAAAKQLLETDGEVKVHKVATAPSTTSARVPT